jgi:hypothetical protein
VRRIYLLLAFIGLVLPYYFFVSFLLKNGLNLQLLISQLFANDIATFFAVDLIITAIVLVVFAYRESQRFRLNNWWVYLVATLLVGPSFAFPLLLYAREPHLEESANPAPSL